MLWCMLALLLVKATTQPIDLQSTTPAPTQQHAAPPPQPTAASMAPDAGEAEPALSSPASLPIDVMKSAERGELHEVVEWLDEGGSVDAMCSVPAGGGEVTAAGMLHVAAVRGNLEVVRELLKRGASVDLQTGLGFSALMAAAGFGHHAIVLLLLQHSANPNHQSNTGQAALMVAAGAGQLACVQTLLRAKADTELVDDNDHTALQYAQDKRERSIAAVSFARCPWTQVFIRQVPLHPGDARKRVGPRLVHTVGRLRARRAVHGRRPAPAAAHVPPAPHSPPAAASPQEEGDG